MQNEPFSSHLGTCANALLWKKTYRSTVKGTLKFPVGWYIYRETYLGQPWLTKKGNVAPVACSMLLCLAALCSALLPGLVSRTWPALWAAPGKGGVAGRRKPAA